MSAVKSWIMIIMVSFFASNILEMLSPSGKTEKVMKIVLGSFLILAIILPFKSLYNKINFDKKFDICSNDSLKENLMDQSIKASEDNIKQIIRDILKKNQITPKKINVFMDKSEDNSILINKIEIYLKNNDSDKRGETKNLIEDALQINTEVLIGSD